MKITKGKLRQIIREEISRPLLTEQEDLQDDLDEFHGALEMVGGGLEVTGDPVLSNMGKGLLGIVASSRGEQHPSLSAKHFIAAHDAVPRVNPPVTVVSSTGEVEGCDADADAGMCAVPEDPGVTSDQLMALGREMSRAITMVMNPSLPLGKAGVASKTMKTLLAQAGVTLARLGTGQSTHNSLRSNLKNMANMANSPVMHDKPAVGDRGAQKGAEVEADDKD